MVRRSVPASSRWTAKAWRSECGLMGLAMPARTRAVRQACSTACVVIGRPKYPGNSHSLWPRDPPVAAQRVEQFRREHDVAVFAAFALGHPDHHPLVVERAGLQANGFRDAQTGSVASRQDRLVFDVFNAAEKMQHLRSAKNDRQLLGLFGSGDA